MKKGFSTGIAILVGLVLVGAIGFMFWQQYSGSSSGVESQTTRLPQARGKIESPKVSQPALAPQAATPIPQNHATAGWKIYKNEKYGFEFKYPSAVSVGSYPNGEYDETLILKDRKGELATIYVDSHSTGLSFDQKLGKYIYEDSGAIATREVERNDWFVDGSGVTVTTIDCLQPLFNNSEILAIRSHAPPGFPIQFTQTVSFSVFTDTGTRIWIQSPWFEYEKPAKPETVEAIVQDYLDRASPIFKTFKLIGNTRLRNAILCRLRERG